jgi:hypothetical protein
MTNDDILTYDEALAGFNALVEEFGAGHLYVSPDVPGELGAACYYVHHDENGLVPGCIVGWLLYKRGYALNQIDMRGSSHYVLSSLGIKADRRTRAFVRAVQAHQDDGYPWGEAVRMAVFEIEQDDTLPAPDLDKPE